MRSQMFEFTILDVYNLKNIVFTLDNILTDLKNANI